MPKKPASYSDWCQRAWPSQYSSEVDEVPRPGSLSRSHSRNRWRNAASSGESPKSMSVPPSGGPAQIRSVDPAVLEHAVQVGADAAEHVSREQRASEVHVGEALPGVADATVDLDGGLAHRARRPGAVRLGERGRQVRLVRGEGVDGPGGLPSDAARALGGDVRVGEEVLDRLEGADRL